MRSTILTTLFFALFALFSAVAYAAPIAPQGVISKRCTYSDCRNTSTNTPSSSSTDTLMDVIYKLLNLYSANTPNTPPTVVTASSSTAATPTGK